MTTCHGLIGALGDVAGVGGAGGAVGGLTDELAGLVEGCRAWGRRRPWRGWWVRSAWRSTLPVTPRVVVAETDSILGSLGDSAVVTGGHIAELSQRVMEYSGFSDEAVRAGANTLLISTRSGLLRCSTGRSRAPPTARRMNTDVPTAARLLGMALQGP